MSPTQEYAHLVFARCLSAQGRLDEAVLLLGRLAAAAEAGNRTEKAIEIVMCQAVALYHLGKTAQALDELRHALALAEPGDYARVFIDEGAPMLALLGKLAHSQDAQEHMRRPSAHYVRQLLSFGWSDILSGPPRSSKAPFCLDRTPHQPPRSSRTP